MTNRSDGKNPCDHRHGRATDRDQRV